MKIDEKVCASLCPVVVLGARAALDRRGAAGEWLRRACRWIPRVEGNVVQHVLLDLGPCFGGYTEILNFS